MIYVPSPNNKLIKLINSKYNNLNEYNIIFGVEHVINFPIQEEEQIDISEYSKKSAFIQFLFMKEKHNYYFYQNFFELFVLILSWGWNICFFSHNREEIDKLAFQKYFIKFLSKYLDNPLETYQYLLKTERIRIFSGNMIKSSFSIRESESAFDIDHLLKKDVSIASEEIKNTILIEHFRPFILGTQYPYIALDTNSSLNFSAYFEVILEKCISKRPKEIPPELHENSYSATNNAAYICGILYNLKKLLNSKKAYSLRQALDIILHDKKYYTNNKTRGQYETPWYLSPLPKNNPYSVKLIAQGEKSINIFKKKLVSILDPIISR